jgi:hypothetical protein
LYAVHYSAARGFAVKPEDHARARFISRAVPGRLSFRERSGPSGLPTDPASHIKESLAALLGAELGVGRVESVQLRSTDDAVAVLRKRFGAGAVLDVRTQHWGLDQGNVVYRARVRMIDLDAGKIVWIGACEWKPIGSVERAPGADDLYADDAHLLQVVLRRAADACVRSLRVSLLASQRL